MVGSLTKTFTGSAVMQLRDRGLLALDDPVALHLPELQVREGLAPVTLRRLLSHESGLTSEPPGSDWGAGIYTTFAEWLPCLDRIGIVIPPNTQSKYSNLGYQLLGEVVARVSGQPYPEYVSEHILRPLGMSSTTFTAYVGGHERRAVGYAPATFSDEFRPARQVRGLGAEGGLWSNVDDLSRWLALQLRGEAGDDEAGSVLSPATLAEMHTARYLVDPVWSEACGISWFSLRQRETIWVGHSGSVYGFMCYAGFVPAEKLGVIVLLNGVADATELALQLGEIARSEVRSVPPAAPPLPPPGAVHDLLGLYCCEDWGYLLRIEWRDGALRALHARDHGLQRTLMPGTEPDRFVVDSGRDAGEPAVFLRAEDGRMLGLRLAFTSYTRLGSLSQAPPKQTGS